MGGMPGIFPIFNSPKGDWNKASQEKIKAQIDDFPIFNSPKGDWNTQKALEMEGNPELSDF